MVNPYENQYGRFTLNSKLSFHNVQQYHMRVPSPDQKSYPKVTLRIFKEFQSSTECQPPSTTAFSFLPLLPSIFQLNKISYVTRITVFAYFDQPILYELYYPYLYPLLFLLSMILSSSIQVLSILFFLYTFIALNFLFVCVFSCVWIFLFVCSFFSVCVFWWELDYSVLGAYFSLWIQYLLFLGLRNHTGYET